MEEKRRVERLPKIGVISSTMNRPDPATFIVYQGVTKPESKSYGVEENPAETCPISPHSTEPSGILAQKQISST